MKQAQHRVGAVLVSVFLFAFTMVSFLLSPVAARWQQSSKRLVGRCAETIALRRCSLGSRCSGQSQLKQLILFASAARMQAAALSYSISDQRQSHSSSLGGSPKRQCRRSFQPLAQIACGVDMHSACQSSGFATSITFPRNTGIYCRSAEVTFSRVLLIQGCC